MPTSSCICLKREISRADIFVRPEIVSFAHHFNDQQAIERAMKQAQADIEYTAAVKAFDKGDYDIEKPLQQRFIRKKLGIINRLKAENLRLKEEMRKSKKSLQKYAEEYYLMGNECITQAHDTRAALANYDKAIELYPEYVDAWVRKGVTLFNANRINEARECLNQAVNLRPNEFKANEFKAVYNRGKLRLHTGDIEGAMTDLDKATSLKPQHAGAQECFADALSQAGKEIEAAIHYRLAEEIRKKKKK